MPRVPPPAAAPAEGGGAEPSALAAPLGSWRVGVSRPCLEAAARAIFKFCKMTIGADAGYIALSDVTGTHNEVVFLDTGSTSCSVDSGLPMPIRGMREVVYRSGKAAYSNDFANSPWAELLPVGHTPLGNVLIAPLAHQGKTVGILGVANKSGGFTDGDARNATLFGEMAAALFLAIGNAETLEHAEDSPRVESNDAPERIGREIAHMRRRQAAPRVARGTLERQVQERTADLLRLNQALQQEIAERKQAIDLARLERDNLRNILNAMEDGVSIIGSRNDVQYVNPALEREFGPFGESACFAYFHQRETPCPWCRKDEVLSGESLRWEWEDPLTGRRFDQFATPLQNPDGSLSELSIRHDVSERARIEAALRESQQLTKRIVDTIPDIIYVYDLKTRRHIYVSRQLAEMLGYPADWLSEDGETRASEMTHPDDTAVRAARFELLKKAADGELVETEYRVRHANGSWRWLQVRDTVLTRCPDGLPRQIVGSARDVTEARRVEQRILEAEEEQRSRVGQDLHDGLGQLLAGVALLAKRIETQLRNRAEPLADDIGQLVEVVVSAMDQAKALAKGLFPIALTGAGLPSALEDLAQNCSVVFGVPCRFGADAGALPLGESAAVHLYRIAQEGIYNAIHHGYAENVWLDIRVDGADLVLTIRDDGIGIPEEAKRKAGVGLRSLRKRASFIGASFDVRPHADGGTILTCRVGSRSVA